MERLTRPSIVSISSAVPSENLGDLCMKMDFCDEFYMCEGCPVKKLIDRLCEYEETGLTPEQIAEMKKSANIKRCRRKRIVGVPKNADRNMIDYGCSRETVAKALKTLKKFKH